MFVLDAEGVDFHLDDLLEVYLALRRHADDALQTP